MKNDQLLAELSEIRYGFSSSGELEVESKDEIRKRLKRSPDMADAVALAFANFLNQPADCGIFFIDW